jgi:synaptobrevin homolog YKT6
MKLISIHIYSKPTTGEPICLGSADDLSFAGYFERGTYREFINFHSRLVISRTDKEERNEIALEKGICYSYVTSDSIGITIITDDEYPKRVAFDLIYKIMNEFNDYVYTNKISISKFTSDTNLKFTYIDTIVKDWQDPKSSK